MGYVLYFWAPLDMNGGVSGSSDFLTFWSMCDMLNGGSCRVAFELAFLKLYDLPPHIEMKHFLHCQRMAATGPHCIAGMFVDSLDSFYINSSVVTDCLLGSTKDEKRHYCPILELLVNVWAYHSTRKMVYLDRHTGILTEQHPMHLRRGFMWPKYFNFTILKSMDEDLAEAAGDGRLSKGSVAMTINRGSTLARNIRKGEGRKIQGEDGQEVENKGEAVFEMNPPSFDHRRSLSWKELLVLTRPELLDLRNAESGSAY